MASLVSKLLPHQSSHPVSRNEIYLPGSLYHDCTLHVLYTLSPPLFVDTHELGQRGEAYSFNHWGSRDLERPVHALPDDPSQLLVNLNIPAEAADSDVVVNVEVPMHLRYGTPRDGPSKPYDYLQVDWPRAFLLCSASVAAENTHPPHELPTHVESVLQASKPGVNLILIPPHSNFTSKTHDTLIIPLGNLQDLSFVEPITALTIFLCFVWLFRVSRRTATRLNVQSRRPKTT